MNEFDVIADIFAPLAIASGAFALQDDAAVISARPGFDLVVTTDAIAEGTDFFAFDPPASVARKALRVNLSDLAAKGAQPEFYLLNLALPQGMTPHWLRNFAEGLAQEQAAFGISLLGGDTSSTEGPLAICVTAFGFVPEGKMLRRKGAQLGDVVYVTGNIGDSGGGLAIFKRENHKLNEAHRDALIARYRVPEPPVAFGAKLRDLANASIDVSDGLIADLGHVARTSGVKLVVDAAAIPRSDALRAFWGDGETAILRAAAAGDDYQIAFTANPSRHETVMAAGRAASVLVTPIGRVEAGEGADLVMGGRVLVVPMPGYRHF
jgi:thiamine-monophosphate kinase